VEGTLGEAVVPMRAKPEGGGGSYCGGQGCSGVTGGNCKNVGLVKIAELAA